MRFISRIVRLGAGLARQKMNSKTTEEEDTVEGELDEVSRSSLAQSSPEISPLFQEPPTSTESASQVPKEVRTSPRTKRTL